MSAEVKKIEDEKDKKSENNEGKDNKEEKDSKDKQESEKDENEKGEEEIKPESEKTLFKRIKEQWQLILKIIELVLCALCLGFFFEPASKSVNIAKHNMEQVALIFLAFTGYMLINAVFIVARCIKDRIPFRISTMFSLVAAVLFFVAAILLIVDREKKFESASYNPHIYLATMLSTSRVFCFINAIIFAVDGVFTYILKKDF